MLIQQKAANNQHWQPPTRPEFQKSLDQALAGAADFEYRTNLGLQCWTFMDRVWERSTNAHHHTGLWKPVRYAGDVIPVVAAGAGGSLVSHVHGTAGSVIGWVALIGGLLGAAINAVRPAAGYGVDLTKAAQFEQLYWDVYHYAMAKLRVDDPEAIAAALKSFAHRMEQVAVLSDAATGTAS